MSTATSALAFIGALFAVVAILAVAFVYFRGSADKAVVESQGRLLASRKEEIDDLTRRLEILETENANLKIAVAQVHGIDHLQSTADAIKADTSALLARGAA